MQSRTTSRNARRYHGLGGTPTYRSWYSMIERCTNPANASWKHYGARGVTVCERWLDLLAFVADMGLRPDGQTIDRMDNAKGYEPGNCRWAPKLEQQRNKGNVRLSPHLARFIRDGLDNGLSQREMAQLLEIDPSLVSRVATGHTWR